MHRQSISSAESILNIISDILHLSKIGCVSTPAQGSGFWFELNLQKQLLPRTEKVPQEPRTLEGQILVVDDNATNRTILEHQLSAAGLLCVVAENAAVALRIVHESDPKMWTAAVLDMHMDGMSGLELASALHSMPSLTQLPVLLLTSLGATIPAADLAKAGVSSYLHKPVKQSALLSAISGTIHEPKAPQRLTATNAGLPQTRSIRPLDSLRLLLAEDNPINQRITVLQLAKLGVKTDLVSNGREALEALRSVPYRVILMDCQMPEMDGYEASRQIRRSEKNGTFGGNRPRVSIIALTAHAMTGDREKCLAAGMDDYVSKPVNPNELVRALNEAVGAAFPDAPSQTLAGDARQIVHLARLRDVAADNPDEMEALFNLFVTQARASLPGLREAIKKNDLPSVHRLAHKVAGSGAACGFERVSGYYRELEAISAGDREGCMTSACQRCEDGLSEVEKEMFRLKETRSLK